MSRCRVFGIVVAIAVVNICATSRDSSSDSSESLTYAVGDEDWFDGVDLSIEDLTAQSETDVFKAEARGLYREELPPGGLMRMAWATPVLRINASSFFPNINVGKLNAKLDEIVVGVFDSFEAKWRGRLCTGKPGKLCDLSDAFFRWQSSGGYRRQLSKHKEFNVCQCVGCVVATTGVGD